MVQCGDADAIAVTWYLGTQTGTGVADVLFGDYNPSARLPISFPQVTGQQPYFYNHLRTRPAGVARPVRVQGALARNA